MKETFTLFGANGTMARALRARLEAEGAHVQSIVRDAWPEPGAFLGHVIFTIGMTADFRNRLVETVELQVVRAFEALEKYRYESFLYLSSTRVYDGGNDTGEEAPLVVRPMLTDHVYNISKLCAESLCLAHDRSTVRVARLSNIFAPTIRSNLFISAVLREALQTGAVTIGQHPNSQKDYADLGDVAEALIAISRRGRHRLYNVASGANTTHAHIADMLQTQGIRVVFSPDAPLVHFAPINVSRLWQEFGCTPRPLHDRLSDVYQMLRNGRQAS